jgi:hypothetical protein
MKTKNTSKHDRHGAISPQAKLAIGELALAIIERNLRPDDIVCRLREAIEGVLDNQFHCRVTHPLSPLRLVTADD